MTLAKPIISLVAVAVVLSLPAPSLAASAARGRSAAGTSTERRALLRSRELWATIDVCTPADQTNTVGVRGSMPGDGRAADVMYMRFRLQYLESSKKQWVDLSKTLPPFTAVGAAKSARQGGFSFQLAPVAGKHAVTLRGVVSFQWRRGARVEYSVSRPTTAGHVSLAGADPKGFSAAECSLG